MNPWKKKQLLLDAGSGSKPWTDADILCDLYVGQTQHRWYRGRAKLDGRPFVCCDLQDMPFRDQSFFFVHCKHVLEHVKNPKLVINELKRVAQHGYISFPSFFRELTIGYNPTHQWIIKTDGTYKPLQSFNRWKKIIGRIWRVNWRIRFRERILLWFFKHVNEKKIRW